MSDDYDYSVDPEKEDTSLIPMGVLFNKAFADIKIMKKRIRHLEKKVFDLPENFHIDVGDGD